MTSIRQEKYRQGENYLNDLTFEIHFHAEGIAASGHYFTETNIAHE